MPLLHTVKLAHEPGGTKEAKEVEKDCGGTRPKHVHDRCLEHL